MSPRVLLGAAIASIALIKLYFVPPSYGVQLQDGTVYFVQPPSLVNAVTTYNEVYAVGATYYFTISLPENAGEPLHRLAINKYEGAENIRFDLKDSVAFEGTRSGKRQKIGLQNVESDRQTQTVTLTFDPPLSPGKTITVGLKPWQNPMNGGVYLFGVTAFPQGEKSHGQFLGFGRLHFYNSTSGSFLPSR